MYGLIGDSSAFYYHVFQDSSPDLHLFDPTSSSGSTFSTSLLFPDVLSATIAPVTTAKSSTTASSFFSDPVFSTSPVSIESVSTKSVIFPQPTSSLLTSSMPAALSQSFSMASPALSAPPVAPQQVPTSHGALHSSSTSLSHNVQDLSLLDLDSPKK